MVRGTQHRSVEESLLLKSEMVYKPNSHGLEVIRGGDKSIRI